MLELVDLGCIRDDRTLFQNLSARLSPGELLQIEGANGSGKTTLLRVLAGLSGDYQGRIVWKGQTLSSIYADFRLSTFYFGHKPAIKAGLTPIENILWRASLRNECPSEQQVIEALQQVSLHGYEDTPCGQLSAGQHRRVALADLFACQSSLWILDEPFTAIDVDGVVWLESLLARHVAEGGMVIITSHQRLSDLSGGIRRIRLDDYLPEYPNAEALVSDDTGEVFL
ncbi:cytochrome c biogenesis heme-transporting ATPase CcmA [Endozoicomonas montiporae]|uniref:Heme exporter subunit CcmA n=1 Tax=Endozoicomonas montiporae CL-33 TaxID=570277 RepID=A0A142BE70_9GAMM|nr:cytochrome c biogenesis heme-transporting ATPase CcmA [Endozoicomonas montiporae]AMO57046.1 heme exporter subunit CcmA [Endozoicomonas montiporae CL-33]